jgi:hypothetical protein
MTGRFADQPSLSLVQKTKNEALLGQTHTNNQTQFVRILKVCCVYCL